MEKSIEIMAPPEKLWEMLALDRLTEWVPGYERDMKSVEYTSEIRTPEDKLRVGASARGIPKKKGDNTHIAMFERMFTLVISRGCSASARIRRLVDPTPGLNDGPFAIWIGWLSQTYG